MGYDAPKIVELVNGGDGSPSMFATGVDAGKMATLHSEIAGDMKALQVAMSSHWEGPAAEQARAGVGPLIQASQVSGEHLTEAQKLYDGQGRSFNDLSAKVKENDPGPKPEATFASDWVPIFTDQDEKIDAWNEKAKKITEGYNLYNGQSQDNSGRWPRDYGQLGLPPGGSDVSVKEVPTGPGGPGHVGGGSPIRSGGQGGDSGGSGSRRPVPPPGGGHVVAPPPGHGGTGGDGGGGQQHPPRTPVQPPPAVDPPGGTDPTRYPQSPPGMRPPGFAPTPTPSPVPVGSGGDSSAPFTGMIGGFGPVGGFGPGGGPEGGAGGRAGGLGGQGQGPGQAGRLTGGAPAAEGGAVKGGGPAGGATGRAGSAGMGGMAPGARGKGEEDREHQRPDYLVEADPDEYFGTDERTSPPVLGL
ncbi:hypothetical protein [Amycolatopsis minnesotensis]|uniref:PPE family protein n=1 Tax=Amycolatopsis minnesotensis TaxID=337894 RepID=A0ABP5BJ22_9PSEU